MIPKNRSKLTRDAAKSKIATGLQRAVAAHGFDQVQVEATCKPSALRTALGHSSLPEIHWVLNALTLDSTVMDEALEAVGFCLTPIEMEFENDLELIAELSALLTEWLDAMKDGKRDHVELMRIASRIRRLLPKLRGVVGEADRLRSVG